MMSTDPHLVHLRQLAHARELARALSQPAPSGSLSEALENLEREAIRRALVAADHNISLAARALGMRSMM
jgi:ActR/RegA family two-component response regulator